MFAAVIVGVNSKNVNRLFDYKIPERLTDVIKVGHRVFVPFGPRHVQAYVMSIHDESDVPAGKVKEIVKVMDVEPVLTDELVELSKKLAAYYIEPYISVIETILPVALKTKSKKVLLLDDAASGEAKFTYDSYAVNGELETKSLHTRELAELVPYIETGEIYEDILIKQHTRKKVQKGVRSLYLNKAPLERAPKQFEALQVIENYNEPVLLTELKAQGYSEAIVRELEKKGYVEKLDMIVERDPYESTVFEADYEKELTTEQADAFNSINAALNDKKDETFLLHGITGSGKTEVYLQLIQTALNNNRDAIMLVPEIALTPQMVNRFKARFGDDVAVLHSALSHGEKYDEWRKIQSGRARVSVGARSSIFAPFKNIGIIIIDEEHETTYKQSERPMYHAAEVAKLRAEYHQCPVVLGSATPSLESYARSSKDVYKRFELTHRPGMQPMPEADIVDMSDEHKDGNSGILSRKLEAAIRDRINKGEQTVLLLNRRGFANFQICQNCGHVPNCPNCDISLTYHKNNNSLLCHYCSYEEQVTRKCADCGSNDVTFRGTGTQKVEEILRDVFNVDIIRMDVDTTQRKGAHEQLLSRFENDNVPILLGTQMIAKGLDYPNVTLVGVLNADTMLNLPDFRANERTFQLLTQVAGRAGRHELPGEVIFQTYNPEHYAITLAMKNNYTEFYEKEMQFRKFARYSPYYFHILFTVSAERIQDCLEATTDIHKTLVDNVSESCIIIGPSPSPIERIKNKNRFQILLKYKREPELKNVLDALDEKYTQIYKKTGLSLKIDVDPQYIM
ncbi:primosomal protein N' [Jeotgalicoccus coquinae]|uniref:Replication restart protein PriA n=1 Tax=Jeotgalicoccus coquinae TaxID=709509 RepID=A0A6V7RJ31_9STAP|nr:primosomal protein N' [Jeotgalicoccus coquinae]MBB6422559.1 primosomal protein N' (replication factor Y) [Jeotgalicoccus coquinae]GGE14925.1 primosomal protein N' [Jeotgalicoccus coquinae]CAD2078085.1 Primosomal protein N' [Jeotgalicoccus coquinae]